MVDPWKDDERGVSPLVGTLLLVAIATVLAGAFFFYVSDLANESQPTPQFGVTSDDDSQTVLVTRADTTALDWSQLQVIGCTAPAGGPVVAGQQLTDCSGRVIIVHTPSNTVIYDRAFPG